MTQTPNNSINEKLYALERARTLSDELFTITTHSVRDELLCNLALAPTADALYDLYTTRNASIHSVEKQEQIQELYDVLQVLRNQNGTIDIQNIANIEGEDARTLRNALRESLWYHRHELMPKTSTVDVDIQEVSNDVVEQISANFPWFQGGVSTLQNMAANKDTHFASEQKNIQANRTAAYEAEVHKNHTQWFTDCAVKLRKYIRQMHTDGLVMTPSFRRIAEDIIDTKKPVLLYGPPGTGKTELALFVGRKLHIDAMPDIRKAYEDNGYTIVSGAELQAMYTEHKKPNESLAAYTIRVQQEKNIITEKYCIEPVLLSGNKEFDHTKLGVKTKLVVQRAPIDKTIDSYREIVERLGLTESEKAVVNDYLNSPIQTVNYLGELLHAMKYGLVVVFDEFNAVPHAIMIMLNHLVTRKAGDVIHPNAGNISPFSVHPNFKYIATGNIGAKYERERIDIAAWNRFGRKINVEYPVFKETPPLHFTPETQSAIDSGLITVLQATNDYMAQWTDEDRTTYRKGGKIKDPVSKTDIEFPGTTDNELFEILATVIVPKKLSGKLPADWGFQLRKLALCAHGIHKAFRGDVSDSRFNSATGKAATAILEKGVPTLRTLSTIVQSWVDDNFSKPLDYYVWQIAVSEATPNRDEREYLAYIYKTIGRFFSDTTVFDPDVQKLVDLQFVGRNASDTAAAKLTPPVLKKYTADDIFTELYGPGPREGSIVHKSTDTQGAKLSAEEERAAMQQTLDVLLNECEALLQEIKDDNELFTECSFDAQFTTAHAQIN